MTVLTLYRAPRRILRKLLKPLALRLNAYRFWLSEREAYRLTVTADALKSAAGGEYRHQVKLLRQRDSIRGW